MGSTLSTICGVPSIKKNFGFHGYGVSINNNRYTYDEAIKIAQQTDGCVGIANDWYMIDSPDWYLISSYTRDASSYGKVVLLVKNEKTFLIHH